MYLEGALSLFMLALTSAFVTVFTVGKINMEKVTLCPVANELRLYLSVLLWFGFLCTAICWLATVPPGNVPQALRLPLQLLDPPPWTPRRRCAPPAADALLDARGQRRW